MWVPVCVHAHTRAHWALLPLSLSLPPTSILSSFSLCLHNHSPSLPECLMESGDARKDDFLSKQEPTLTPLLSVPTISFPVILKMDLQCFPGGGRGLLSPAPLLPPGACICRPCTVAISSLRAQGAQCCPRLLASSG